MSKENKQYKGRKSRARDSSQLLPSSLKMNAHWAGSFHLKVEIGRGKFAKSRQKLHISWAKRPRAASNYQTFEPRITPKGVERLLVCCSTRSCYVDQKTSTRHTLFSLFHETHSVENKIPPLKKFHFHFPLDFRKEIISMLNFRLQLNYEKRLTWKKKS